MKKLLLFLYSTLRWIIVIVLFLVLLLVFLIENPSVALKLASSPLKQQGITYGEMEGGLLSGFRLKGFNYQNKIEAKEVALSIDYNKLEDKVLYIKNIEIDSLHIDKDYLSSLIDTNSTKEEDKNSSIPLKEIIVKNADISLRDITYDKYQVNSAHIKIKDFKTDIKKEYKGDVDLVLDSNVTQLNLKSHINNDYIKLSSDIELNREFIAQYVKDKNVTFLSNPAFKIRANGDMDKFDYYLDTKSLKVQQNEYKIDAKKLKLSGDYSINHKDLNLKIDTNLKGNMAKLSLNGDTQLNLDDLNNTLKFNINSDIWANSGFVSSFVADKNISFLSNPAFEVRAKGDMKKLDYYLDTKSLKLKQNDYIIDTKKLEASGDYSVNNKDLNLKIDTKLDGNIAKLSLNGDTQLNLDDLNNTLKFNINSNIWANSKFVNSFVADKNISFLSNPAFEIRAKGDMKKLDYYLDTKSLKLKQNEYKIDTKKLRAKGDYSILDKDLKLNIDTNLYGNMAKLSLSGDTALNLDDLNNTLRFNLKSNILANKNFIKSQLKDKNISVIKISPLYLSANGDMNKTNFDIKLNSLKAKYNDIFLNKASISINGDTKPLQGDTNINLFTKLLSSVGSGKVDSKSSLNFHDLNNTLKYKAKIDFLAKSGYINKFIKDKKIKVINRPKLNMDVNGGLEKITTKTDLKIDIKKDKIVSAIILKTKPISLNIKTHQVKGSFKLFNNAKNMKFKINSAFNGDYQNPKEMQTNTKIEINQFNDFGVNLTPLVPLRAYLQNGKHGVKFNIYSKRIKANAQTKDYDNIIFNINTKNLYLYKIIEVPQELEHKFIRLNLKGSAIISKKFIDTKGYIYSNKKFKAKIDIHNNKKGLNTKISTKHFVILANGNIEKKNIDASINIDSIKELQEEINKVYPFNKFDIDGNLKMNAKLRGEKAWAEIKSPKLKFNGFSIKNLNIDADYKKELVTINKFRFKTTGFKNKKLNNEIHLNRKGKIYLGETKKIDIDMYPNIKIKANGNDSTMDGKVTIKKLPLGHPDYGSMVLNCDIDYQQRDEYKTITGYVKMKELKVFYEPKFLSIDYDPDVVVITKKDKKKNIDSKDDTFLKYTKINLSVKAPQAQYKTPDIDLTFDVDLQVDKEFGENLALLGKIKDIEGHFDQIPKRFEIENSNIVFKGGEKINPLLDIKVKYELPQVVIYINIGGDANHPKLEFTSDPAMPKKDIMSYLLLGVASNNIKSDGSLGREAELFILNQAARDLAYEFDLDRVFIKDDGTGEGYAIEVGKKVSKKNMFIIESSKEGNSFILEHDINKNIKFRVGHHQTEHPSDSVDVFFRKRFR